ncbi:Helicase IV [Corynebacterium kalinowskii]|uniref:Helicase IV n=1 Tax=Corynebacterium kalinowskii TaxID=2675216 RepID=A0A6B8VX78_9CORY|nr:UvrD-helicase domain-containing protein [Corynebacterium kalinowskii]QGU01890.1 Helicase IV [Corynebacterium kalinowskii]
MSEIAAEQRYLDGLFDRIDAEVTKANERLKEVMLRVDRCERDAEALVERETEYHALNEKLDKLTLAQLGLVFGRIDVADDQPENPVRPDLDRRYIGRIGMDDREDGYRTLLLDWRAPLARPFYLATTAEPLGVEKRRHIRTKGRTVVSVDDENLTQATEDSNVAGESALVAALNAARGSHMNSIVETIQREQDEIIRDPTRGVMVVEGGPGTGKTAVALHRVAYLLYSWREQLAKTGVLIIGPNDVFLEYISHVLPELGETGVVLATTGNLLVEPSEQDSLLAREVKGSEEMVYILKKAVQAYQVVPADRTLRIGSLDIICTSAMVSKARATARRSRRPHNDARPIFADSLIDQLAHALASVIGADPLGGKNLLSAGDIAELHDELAEEPLVNQLIDELWPELEAETVLKELLTSRTRIAEVAHEYDEETQDALYQPHDGWTPTDSALIDELHQLIGIPSESSLTEDWDQEVLEAQAALDILEGSAVQDTDDGFDAEVLQAHDVIDAETLASRQQVRDDRSTAQRARADLTWAYGHVVVDEAQELSPMEWRMVMRRCPSRWMTLVGDTAQTGSPAGVDSWAETLDPFVGDRFIRKSLTVNYRTPRPIAEYAQIPAESIRDGEPVRYGKVADLEKYLPKDGRSYVIIRPGEVENVKGLEFDHVMVVNPDQILAGPQGRQNLYVAVTRATQTLTVLD